MKLEVSIRVAPYTFKRYQSEYNPDLKTVALDLITQMRADAAKYPALNKMIAELRGAYGTG